MVPVRVRELKCATHGPPLVPPVNPPQSNRSCVALCRVVQLMHLPGGPVDAGDRGVGAGRVSGDPVTRTRYRNPESMPSRLAARPARPAKSSQPGAAATRSGRPDGPLRCRLSPARWTI